MNDRHNKKQAQVLAPNSPDVARIRAGLCGRHTADNDAPMARCSADSGGRIAEHRSGSGRSQKVADNSIRDQLQADRGIVQRYDAGSPGQSSQGRRGRILAGIQYLDGCRGSFSGGACQCDDNGRDRTCDCQGDCRRSGLQGHCSEDKGSQSNEQRIPGGKDSADGSSYGLRKVGRRDSQSERCKDSRQGMAVSIGRTNQRATFRSQWAKSTNEREVHSGWRRSGVSWRSVGVGSEHHSMQMRLPLQYR